MLNTVNLPALPLITEFCGSHHVAYGVTQGFVCLSGENELLDRGNNAPALSLGNKIKYLSGNLLKYSDG